MNLLLLYLLFHVPYCYAEYAWLEVQGNRDGQKMVRRVFIKETHSLRLSWVYQKHSDPISVLAKLSVEPQ